MTKTQVADRIRKAAEELEEALWVSQQWGYGFACEISWEPGVTAAFRPIKVPKITVTLDGVTINPRPDVFVGLPVEREG